VGPWLALLTGAAGCNAVLGLGDFTDAPATTATATTTTSAAGGTGQGGSGHGGGTTSTSTSTSTSTTGSSTGGAGGAGGSGGGHQFQCAADALQTLFTAGELTGASVDDKGLWVISEPRTKQSNTAHVHVVVHDSKNGKLYARTWHGQNQQQLGPLVTLDVGARFQGIYRTDTTVVLAGTFWGQNGQHGGVGEIQIAIDPQKRELTGTPTQALVSPPPGDCTDPGASHFSFIESIGGSPRLFAGTCELAGTRTLYAGALGGAAEIVDTGTANDERLYATRIEPVGPIKLLVLGSDAGAWVRAGTKTLELKKPVRLDLDPPRVTLPYAMPPLPNGQGAALVLATLTPQTFVPATIFGARVTAKDVPTLLAAPATLAQRLGEYDTLDEVNLWSWPSLDPLTLFAAGAAKTGSVRLYWLSRDLGVRIFGFEVDKPAAANTYFDDAAAAHTSDITALVVHTKRDPQNNLSVEARSVTCL
jgi:hypothetical protein